MKQENYEIAIGIPTLNESENIAYVTQQIDLGLAKYYPECRCIIVNVDNHSDDNTKEHFLATNTRAKKHYISTAENCVGKGRNIENFLQFACETQVNAAAIFDADLQSLQPQWIEKVIRPLIKHHADFVYPHYWRDRFDGTITNQLCYPLLVGLLGNTIRQPIGGDFGFSKKLIQFLAQKPLPDYAHEFGIDIYLTTEAVMNQFQITAANLIEKKHRARAHENLILMLMQVTTALFQQLLTYRVLDTHSQRSTMKRPLNELEFKSVKKVMLENHVPATFDSQFINTYLQTEMPKYIAFYKTIFDEPCFTKISQQQLINSFTWCQIVKTVVLRYMLYPELRTEIIHCLPVLFFLRLKSYAAEVQNLTMQEVENYLANQAWMFFENF